MTRQIQKTVIALVESTGNTLAIHKSLLCFKALQQSLNISINPVFVINDNNTPKTLQNYKVTNESLIAAINAVFVESNQRTAEIKKAQSTKETYFAYFYEGDAIDTISFTELLKSTDTVGVVAYPSVRTTYHPGAPWLNSIWQYPTFPSNEPDTLLASLTSPSLGRFFIVSTETLATINDVDANLGGQPSWRLILELLGAGSTLKKVDNSVIFSSGKSNTLKAWNSTPAISSSFNSLEKLKSLTNTVELPDTTAQLSSKERIKHLLKNSPALTFAGQKTLHYISVAKKHAPRLNTPRYNQLTSNDSWLVKAAEEVHQHNASVFLSLAKKYPFAPHTLSEEKLLTPGRALAACVSDLQSNTYDYVFLAPWLIAGGADMFFVNYVNTVARLHPNQKVLIVSTEPSRTSLSNQELHIADNVTFVRLAELFDEEEDSKNELFKTLTILIELVHARVVHVGLSELGYKYVKKYHSSFAKLNRKIILTGYNEIVTSDKKREGYVHEIIPSIFQYADAVTTDNQKIIDLWSTEYGLDATKALVHHQPFSVPKVQRVPAKAYTKDRPVRILWAAHIRKEKNPLTYRKVAESLINDPRFSFTAFGALDKAHYPFNPFVRSPLQNLHYKGGYKNFQKDINPDDYDLFMYTSLADGTPNILIEAGMSELPIITSGVGGIKKLIGANGTIIEPAENAEAYVRELQAFAQNPSDLLKKATAFKKRLIKTQTMDSFESEVEYMLKMVKY